MALIDFTTTFYIVVGIAVLHTLAGPDHYLTFWSLAKSHKWSTRRTSPFYYHLWFGACHGIPTDGIASYLLWEENTGCARYSGLKSGTCCLGINFYRSVLHLPRL